VKIKVKLNQIKNLMCQKPVELEEEKDNKKGVFNLSNKIKKIHLV